MATELTTNIEFLKGVCNSLPKAMIIIDHDLNIISINSLAKEILESNDDATNFLSLFNENNHKRFETLIENADRANYNSKEVGSFQLASGEIIHLEFTATSYTNENEKFFFIFLDKNILNKKEKKNVDYKIFSEDLSYVIKNKKLLEIIDQIKSSYPFTFLGKAKIQMEVNKLEELFWIKDPDDAYILVNKAFAKSLGLFVSQIEGKQESKYIPNYLSEFVKASNSYLKESLNTIIFEGVPVKGLLSAGEYKTIEFPLVDAENHVLAIIGTAIKVDEENSSLDESTKLLQSQIKYLPINFCVIDAELKIVNASEKFSSLFNSSINKISSTKISDIFTKKIIEKIKEVLSNLSENDKAEISDFIDQKGNFAKLTISKIDSEKEELNHYFLIVEYLSGLDNLEELLKRRGRMFDVLIKNNPEAIFIYDAENLRFLEVNTAASELYGYTRDEFLQMDLTDLYSPEDIQTLLENSNVSNKEKKFLGPFKHKKKDGTSILIELFKEQFTFDKKVAHFNIVRNVSHLAEKEKEFQLYKSTFDNTDDLIFITDSNGFIKFTNNAVHKYLGFPKNMILDSSFISLLQDEDRGIVNSSVFYSQLKDSLTISITFKKATDGKLFADLIAIPIFNFNGEIDSYNLIARLDKSTNEIVKEIIVEKEIIKEVVVERENNSGNNSIVKGLEPSMLSMVFHEILTPVNVMLGFLHEIDESISTPTPEQKEFLGYINQNSVQLIEIMNSVSEYAQMSSSPLTTKNFTIDSILKKIDLNSKDFLKKVGKQLVQNKVSASMNVDSDEEKLKSFITFLIKLSASITDEDKIYLSIYQNDEEHFIISLRDELGKLTEKMLNSFKRIIDNNDISVIREYGHSRFALMSIKKLSNELQSKFELILKSGKPYEIGFVLPLKLSVVPTDFEIVTSNEKKIVENLMPQQEETFVNVSEKKFIKPQPIQVVEEEEEVQQVPDAPKQKTVVEFTQPKETYQPSVKDPVDLSKMSCLYIEDQVDSQILFKVQMKEIRNIQFAVSFEEALPLITSNKFDFIIMDINLQGEYNGLDALKMIRQMPGFLTIPIVAVTAYVLPGDKDKFIAAGFTDFMSKPIFREKMISVIEKIFS